MQKRIAYCGSIVVTMVLFVVLLRSSVPFQFLLKDSDLKTVALFPRPRPVDAVMIVTAMRSGSSFFGSIFNLRRNVTYLYEPLIAVNRYKHRSCHDVKRKEDSIAIVKGIAGCHFEDLVPIIQQVDSKKDSISRCKDYNMCFVQPASSKYGLFLSRDAGICQPLKDNNHKCPEPIDPEMVNEHCRKSQLKVLKMIYLCKLEWLQSLIEDPDLNIKVIHLVRDPRSTICSRTRDLKFDSKRLNANIKDLCENRFIPNLQYANNFLRTGKWRNKYMRIRYEDFVLNPVGKTVTIFKDLGINMTMEVRNWLISATSSDNAKDLSIKQPWNLKRNVDSVLTDWRNQLSFEQVEMIQEKCGSVLKELGYKIFNNASELKNLNNLHFTPEW